jgi:superoxide dismutase, Cu-Zn family
VIGTTFEVHSGFILHQLIKLKNSNMKKAVILPYRSLLFVSFFATVLIMSCNNSTNSTTGENKEDSTAASGPKVADAILSATKTDTALNGTAHFTQEGDGQVKLELSVNVPLLAGRSVAVHIHEHGDCGDAGKNTHGHWNPTGKQHGKWGSAEFHLGDIGNVSLDSTGKGAMTLETDLWSIGGDANKDILNKAIIVHSGVDDFTTQPTGNAGSRIGCGLIEKK